MSSLGAVPGRWRAKGAAALLSIITLGVACGPTPAPAADPVLGVQTHFAQGWPGSRLDLTRGAGARALRDSVPWARVETVAGRYAVGGPNVAALDRFCRQGGTLLLTAVPLNPLYDGGGPLRSPAAKQAFAQYLLALQDHFGACLTAIEIGNEVNAAKSRQIYRADDTGVDPLREYVDLVRIAHQAFAARPARPRILGGSSNMIATGFLDSLFTRGLLDAVDGIAVHPYRSQAENVDVELARLQTVMRARGRVVPVWATEFSDNFPEPENAAPQLLKSMTLMAASGIEAAYWYALVDQQWFRNMGLYAANGGEKPAARAFRLAQDALLTRGRPQRVDTGDANVRLYRFGKDAWIAWGASGRLTFNAGAALFDPQGRRRSGTEVDLEDDPVIVTGATSYRLTRGPVVADSLLGYAAAPWSYLARKANGVERRLGWLDGQWTSQHGDRLLRPLWIGDVGGAPAGGGAKGMDAIVRYTAPAAGTVSLAACIDKRAGGDGIDVAVMRGTTRLATTRVTGTEPQRFTLRNLTLAAGDTLDLVVGPNQAPGSDGFRYRIRIAAEPHAATAECPARPAKV